MAGPTGATGPGGATGPTGPSDAHARVTTDVSITTAANVTGLSFAIGASEIWTAEFFLYISPGAGAGIDFALTGPASPTNVVATVHGNTSSLTAFSAASLTALSAFTNVGFVTVSGGSGPVRIALCVENGTNAGTIQLQAQQHTSGTQTVKRGSYLNARKIT